ncbi:CoA transferase [Arthrobacter sp. I2-34]|uniref:CoA transferase n=1 Tax=Arthrobacter hankyongi TaxID=2904801 RepID=A0ABS9L4A0_9MICC|nr:CoA transferase [Arthrobacter hankyongi]MCG2621314.1 CoA transferase [Arthrobacter hankyongi]
MTDQSQKTYTADGQSAVPGPLAGLKVVDFSLLGPGPFFTQCLLELGADVLKVEPPRGDPARYLSPGGYAVLNSQKSIRSLDLKTAAGAVEARALLADADVLVEGFRPGVMERLGFGFKDVSQLRPALVYVSLSGFGQESPLADMPGHDINYLAASGVLALAGTVGAPPAHAMGVPIGDFCSSIYALSSTLAALLVSRSMGQGQHLDVSVTDSLIHWMNSSLAQFQYKGLQTLDEQRASVLGKPAYGVFQTADSRSIALGALEDHFWQRLARALALESELEEADFAFRAANVARINGAISASLGKLTLQEALGLLQAADVPANAVVSPLDLPNTDYAASRGLFAAVDGLTYSRFPVRVSGGGAAASGHSTAS